MKQLLYSTRCLMAASVIFFSSCSKDDSGTDGGGGGGTTTSTLNIGKAAVGFSTSATFGGILGFSKMDSAGTQAISSTVAGIRYVNVIARQDLGNDFRKAELDFEFPVGTSTSGGNITVPLTVSSTAVINAKLSLYTGSDINVTNSFFAESGTAVITKLSSSEIKGTFSGVVRSTMDNSTITITNGTFEGRFN